MSYAHVLGFAALIGCSAATVACSSHGCVDDYVACDQTRITLQSANNAWAAGTYTLGLTVDGASTQCTVVMPASPGNTIQGTCSSTDTTLTLTQLCPQPAPVCNATVCMGTVSSANCLEGQYQMNVVVSSGYGSDAQAHVASQVSVDLSVDGGPLLKQTLSPQAATNEPNGAGCGTCTNATATALLSGG